MNDPDSPEYSDHDASSANTRLTPEEKEIERLERALDAMRKWKDREVAERFKLTDQLSEIRESCSIVRMQDHFGDTPLQAVMAQQSMQRKQLTAAQETIATYQIKLEVALKTREECRNTLRAIYDETDPYADGAPDASAHDLLCNKISGLVIGALGREGVDPKNDEQRGQDEDWHETEKHEGEQ